jgi:hypothetical protein
VDTERRVGCSMDSSCELLSSVDPASGSVHCCQVPCRTLRSVSKHPSRGDVRAYRVCVSPEVYASLRKPASRIGVYVEARRALL